MPFAESSKNTMLDQLVTTDGPFYAALIRTGGAEASGVGSGGTPYARIQVTFGAASGGNKANSAQIQWDNGGATDWSNDIDKWKLYDALTNGNEKANGNLQASRDMSVANATLTIEVGDLDLDLNDS